MSDFFKKLKWDFEEPSEIQKQFPLMSKKVIKKFIQSLKWIFVVSLGFFIFFAAIKIVPEIASNKKFDIFFIINWLPFFIIFIVVLLVYVYWFERLYFKTYRYDLTDEYFIVKKGVFSRSEIIVPFYRIQDIYVDQDLLDRFFGLYDVHITTATTSSIGSAHIDGLNKESAEELKKIILQKTKRSL